jgi:hypothetical protein
MSTLGIDSQKTNTRDDASLKWTRTLLSCGILSGSIFYVLAIPQIFTRSGFDIRHNLISQLSLGNLGWSRSLTSW